jgi:hypothetical protein
MLIFERKRRQKKRKAKG